MSRTRSLTEAPIYPCFDEVRFARGELPHQRACQAGCIELVKTEPTVAAVEHYYRGIAQQYLYDGFWSKLSHTVQSEISWPGSALVVGDARQSVIAGIFNRKEDRHASVVSYNLGEGAGRRRPPSWPRRWTGSWRSAHRVRAARQKVRWRATPSGRPSACWDSSRQRVSRGQLDDVVHRRFEPPELLDGRLRERPPPLDHSPDHRQPPFGPKWALA